MYAFNFKWITLYNNLKYFILIFVYFFLFKNYYLDGNEFFVEERNREGPNDQGANIVEHLNDQIHNNGF
jgi:hypothetical protein